MPPEDTTHRIEPLPRPASDVDLRALAELLSDTVEAGGVVGLLAPLPVDAAERWWRDALQGASDGTTVLVARDAGRIVGTVQYRPAPAPNQPHRAEVVKLLVHRESRGAGIGAALMERIEDAAREAGFTMLTLDTKKGTAAERLYRRAGWTHAGTLPDFAVDPDGRTTHDAAIFYKRP